MTSNLTKRALSLFAIFIFISCRMGFSQSTNDLLNLLISNKSITQEQADSLRADAGIKQQEAEAARKSFPMNTSRLIQLTGYTQVRYQQLEESGKNSGFDVRRARIDIRGAITPWFGYRVQTEFAGSPKLLDAYSEIKIADYFTITAGQFKIPFSLENLASSNKLDMIDRSQAVEALVARSKDILGNTNGRDIGLQVSGTFLKISGVPVVEYRIALFNGSGINVADTANSNKDIAARLIVTPLKGLSFGGSIYNGFDKVTKPDVKGQSQTRDRVGLEVSYVRPRLSLKGEYLSGKDGIIKRAGWYIQAGYFVIPSKVQVLAKYDSYDPNTGKADNISTNYSFGGNLNFNTWSRLQMFYTIRSEEGTAIKNNFLSVQYQIGF